MAQFDYLQTFGKGGDLRLHPIAAQLVDVERLEKMGVSKMPPTATSGDMIR